MVRKPKILFIIDYLYEIGGTEKHLLQLLNNLTKSKYETYLLALDYSEETLQKFSNHCTEALTWPLQRIFSFETPSYIRNLNRFVHQKKINIVQSYNAVSDIVGAMITRDNQQLHQVINFRDLGKYRHKHYDLALKLFSSKRQHYIAVSDKVGDYYVQKYKLPPDKIYTIYNGIDFSTNGKSENDDRRKIANREKISKNAFIVGNISHFRSEKAHDLFFKAFEIASKRIPKIVALMVGGGPLLEKYRHQYVSLVNCGKVLFTGYREDATELIECMDIFCMTPRSNEGFSNSLLEAMAFGKPVIATDVGGNREAIIQNETGFIVPVDYQAVADCIIKLYENTKLREIMGKNAKKRVETNFSLDHVINQYEEFYRNCLDGGYEK